MHFRNAAALALVAATALPAFAPLSSSGQTAAEPALQPRRLENGLDVLVFEKHQAPIVTIEIAVKTGAFTEDKTTNGLSHLYEHMFFKGNARIPTQEGYMKRMSELGISFNGTTDNERVNYFITLPTKNFAAGMQFIADALLTPNFDQAELEKERKVVIGEYDRNESRPEYWLHVAMGKAGYGDDYIRKNPLGVRETILTATRETMVKFKETFYVPNNSLLSIVGDVNATEAHALAETLFGGASWKRAPDPHSPARRPIVRLESSKAVVVGRERAQPSLAVAWNGPDTSRDAASTYVADVWGQLVNQQHGHFQHAFRDARLATRASLGYRTQHDGGEISFQASLLKPATVVRDALWKELAAMLEPNYFNAEDLAIAKSELHTNEAYSHEAGDRLSHDITFHWAIASIDYYNTYYAHTDKVTLDDVRAFVRDYLVGRPCVIGALLSQEALDESKLDETTLLGTAPEAQSSCLALAVKSIRLSNGIRAIVRQDPTTAIGALQIYIDGGAANLTKETQGLERLALASALEGSKTHPRDELKKMLATYGARVGHENTFDYSGVTIQAPHRRVGGTLLSGGNAVGARDAFELACEAVVSCLKEPELEGKVLLQKRDEILENLKREQGDADRLVNRATYNLLFPGHAYANRVDGTPETINAFDVAAIKDALARGLVPSRLLLVVVSNKTVDEAEKLLEGLFSWVKPGADGEVKPVALGAFKPTEVAQFVKRKNPTTYVKGVLAMPAPTDEGYAAAKVLMQVCHRRFWESIRTKYALSYAPSAGIASFRSNYGVLYVTSTDPNRSVAVMFEELKRLQDELVPASELQGIVATDATRRFQRGESAAAHAQGLGASELVAGGWKRYYDENDELSRVTPEQVRDAAKKLFKDIHWGVVGPEPIDEKLLVFGQAPQANDSAPAPSKPTPNEPDDSKDPK